MNLRSLASPKAMRLPFPPGTRARQLNWLTIPVVAFWHGISLFVFSTWLFDWRSVVLMVLTVPAFGIGINLCYHRQLAHRSFRTSKGLEHFFVTIALCCLQDTPIRWVANHRIHHAKSDTASDIHSPLVSFFWAHCGWLFLFNADTTPLECYQRYVRDLLADGWYLQIEKGYLREWIYFGHAALFFIGGCLLGYLSTSEWHEGLRLGLSFLVWGVVLRTVLIWHVTWSVNSLSHQIGYRNYDTNDHSRNNLLVGYLAAGEGWHNNHHADPACATTQRKWWELDFVYYVIKGLEALGLAHDLVKPGRGNKLSAIVQP